MKVVRRGLIGISGACSSCGAVTPLDKGLCHEAEGGYRLIPSVKCRCGHVADFAAEPYGGPAVDPRLHWLERINPWWIRLGLGAMAAAAVIVVYVAREPRPASSVSLSSSADLVEALKVKTEWKKAGFDNVAIATLSVENCGSSAAKDIEFTCTAFGASGTRISGLKKTVYSTVDGRGRATFREVNLGLIDPQTARLECTVTGASPSL